MKRLIFLFLISALPVYGSQQLEETRSIVKEWVATKKTISKEVMAWKDKEVHLNDLIKLTKIEIEQLEKEIAVVEAFTSTAEKTFCCEKKR